MKGPAALCLQTGNVSRFYADILKLQFSFAEGRCRYGILIVPTPKAARTIGSNIANFERLRNELKLFGKIITMPLLVLGIQ